MLKVKTSKQFKKDLKKIQNNKNLLNKLQVVINKIASFKELEINFKDHQLKWELSNFRECHVTPDFLLIYKVEKEELILILARAWTHSELF